jgi:hypothetical protein
MVGGAWALRREVTLTANASGRTVLPVTFSIAGHWAVRAIAPPTSRNANSVWSPLELYEVR